MPKDSIFHCQVVSFRNFRANFKSVVKDARPSKRSIISRPHEEPEAGRTPPPVPPASRRTDTAQAADASGLWKDSQNIMQSPKRSVTTGAVSGGPPYGGLLKVKMFRKGSARAKSYTPPPHPPIVLSLDCLISICPFSYFFSKLLWGKNIRCV